MEKPVVLFMVGPPAAGKSTWSKEFIKKNPRWLRVNRDDFRYMLLDEGKVPEFLERTIINELMELTILRSVQLNFNIIVDNTNCSLSVMNEIVKLVEGQADVYYKFFDVSFSELVNRDKARERSVGEEVIKMHFDDLQKMKFHNKCEVCNAENKECGNCHGFGFKLDFKIWED